MKRAVQIGIGKPSEVVILEDFTPSAPADNEVLVAVQASPINPADLLRLTGQHAYKPILPSTAGIEGVGIVEAVGQAVTDVRRGDVVLLPYGGVWTQRYLCPSAHVVPLPPEINLLQASMLGVNPVTAAGLLNNFRQLADGDWLIQNAANSAVGRILIQLAAKRGIHTVNIVRRESLVADLEALGADVVLVGEDDLPQRVADATRGAAIHLALDAIAGNASGRLAACLAENSTMVIYGLLSGEPVALPAAQMVFGNLTVTGFSRLRVLSQMARADLVTMYHELAAMVMRGELYTHIERTYPLAEVKAALDHAEREAREGKIVLSMV